MKRVKKIVCLILCLLLCISNTAFAHSGRTDSNGGHHDYKNKSGLGSYHYHCGGHPAHLHKNGVCLYSKKAKKKAAKTPKLSKSSAVVANGKTCKLSVKNTGGKKVTWKSSNKKVATVSKKGVVKARKAGKTTITAKVKGKTLKCKIKVVAPYLNKTSVTLMEGEEVWLRVKGTSSEVVWSSSDEWVAEVDEDGYVYAEEAGTAVITAKVNGIKLKCRITVQAEEEPDDPEYF